MTEPELCRLCAETKENFIGIYDAEGQKLAIEAKIAKCLQIQVLITDGLPLTVCIDCCILLNQCNEFFEKTNQAQTSLRQLLVDSKSQSQSLETNINYIQKTVAFPKEEEEVTEGIVECHLANNYIQESNVPCNYFIEENKTSNHQKYEAKESQDTMKQKKCKIQMKKTPLKQTRKRLKRKNQNPKIEDPNIYINSDLEKEHNNMNVKTNVKIPDNYMTGTDSDLEIIEAHTTDTLKFGHKRGENLDRYPWLCTDCNDKLPSLEGLEEHHESVHNQQAKYMCVLCCKVYDKYYGFLTHVKRHKNKAKFSRCHLPDTMKNRFPCDQCDKRFSTKPNLVTHKRIHSGVRNFTCDQCGKSFIQKGNLEAHFLTHSADKPYNCSQCSKAFKTPLQLKKHETVHTGAKPHQCAVCGRTFREKGTLREHHRIHTGAMPFTCEFCGKCFRFKGILTTHRRQHTGERPYSCLECQHHFTNWPNYNKHMKRRHGINTSHTKHLSQSQQSESQQQLHQQQQQSEQPQTIQSSTSEDPLSISHTESTTVQAIQTVSHASTTQPIVVQTIPTTAIQNFQPDVSSTIQDTVFRERNATYFNAMPATLQNFVPPNLPYNFYNISNVTYRE
ncbi:zinc finger protein 613-like isoform X2 [Colletes gigas]|uniref:zinc finger protein 613-like isoform X2 n=1 Tax=Colletes gigas TaxID=935657 RepID=UPI001C9AFC5A|nr:zinc finger protein 613-like isoform X2 [Colletes gigas]